MRIIHARKKVWAEDFAFKNKFTLLVWILSILKWKEYGNQVVLYTDKEELEKIKEIGFDYLYDEINTDLLEKTYNIDFYYYWAMPKIIALQHETQTLNNKVVVCDQDVVPMQDLSRMWNISQVVVWSNKEFCEFNKLYPNELSELSIPKNYKFPKWYIGKSKPLNTGVIYFKDNKIAKEYCEEVFRYVCDNNNDKKNNRAIAMCNAEQRMLGEFVKYKNLTYTTIQPVNQGLFNKNAFHTHGYKNRVMYTNELQWILTLLKMIEKCDEKMYNKLMSNSMFEYEREEIKKEFKPVKQLEVYYGESNT